MNINIITDAINKHRVLNIEYRDKEGNLSNREVEPYEIKGGKCYAYCLNRHGIRAFTLSSIVSVKNTDMTFTPRF